MVNAIKKCQELPGQQLFQYIDEDGKRQNIESSDVNTYLNNIVENNLTAKDFRCWGATIFAARLLSRCLPPDNNIDTDKNVIMVVKETAKALNNTPAICKKYYIHPDILKSYYDEYIFQVFSESITQNKYGLTSEEKAVHKILKRYSKL